MGAETSGKGRDMRIMIFSSVFAGMLAGALVMAQSAPTLESSALNESVLQD